jgi:hypothetical protein
MQPVPFLTQEFPKRIPGRKRHPDPIRPKLLYRRPAKIVRLTDSHSARSLGSAARRSKTSPEVLGNRPQGSPEAGRFSRG